MNRGDFRRALTDLLWELFPNDDCSEFDEMTMADIGAFMLAFQSWLSEHF